jgi:hypothetical protein
MSSPRDPEERRFYARGVRRFTAATIVMVVAIVALGIWIIVTHG